MSQYINENNDAEIFHYGNEMTMASLFVSGNLKRNASLTGVQEYGTICTKEGKEVIGRPDIFIKSEKNAIWIECKYQRNISPLSNEHWDIPSWLEWDGKNAFSQVETYYNSERSLINNSYDKHYLVTLCFKLIKEDRQEHFKEIRTQLHSKINEECERIWYYQVGFVNDSAIECLGLEVYGTCFEVPRIITAIN